MASDYSAAAKPLVRKNGNHDSGIKLVPANRNDGFLTPDLWWKKYRNIQQDKNGSQTTDDRGKEEHHPSVLRRIRYRKC